MEEIINNFAAYAAVIGPAIMSIVSIIVAAATTIKKVKKSTTDSVEEIKKYKALLSKILEDNELLQENFSQAINALEETKSELSQCRRQMITQTDVISTQKENLIKIQRELTTIKNQNLKKGK